MSVKTVKRLLAWGVFAAFCGIMFIGNGQVGPVSLITKRDTAHDRVLVGHILKRCGVVEQVLEVKFAGLMHWTYETHLKMEDDGTSLVTTHIYDHRPGKVVCIPANIPVYN